MDGDRYRLDPEDVSIDYWEFLAAINAAGSPHGRSESSSASSRSAAAAALDGNTLAALRAAHDLYRGSLADGLGAEWVLSVREATRRGFLSATARLVRHHVADTPAEALGLLEKARNLDPTNESLYRDIIALQLKTGDNDAAENTLRLLKTQLADIDETVSDTIVALARNISTTRNNSRLGPTTAPDPGQRH